MDSVDRINRISSVLRIGLGASAFLAGADKFTNLLTRWEKYLAPQARERLPISGKNFMRAVGVIEMAVGAGILAGPTRLSSYVASGWLAAIAANLVLNGDYDIAVRDLNMALGAAALGELTAIRERRQPRSIVQAPHVDELLPEPRRTRKVTFSGATRRRPAA
jgi:uncharacterized membrane protein YphA (DoxX/SURF4 family)